MITSARNWSTFQLPWVNHVITITTFILVVTLASMCVFCLNCRKKPKYHGIDDDYPDTDEWSEKKKNRGCDNGNGKSGNYIGKLKRGKTVRHQSTKPVLAQLPHQQLPSLNQFDNQITGINIQPAHEDHMANDSIRNGTVALPSRIPEVPVDQSEDLGTIYFSICYDVFTQLLKVLIKKAERLPAKDLFGTSDPFVKIILLPNKKHKLETRVRKKKLNPSWNEVFTFEGFPHDKLVQRRLYLQVLDYDRFSRNDEIGEVELSLADVPLQKDPVEFAQELRPCKNATGCLGDILLALCYKPNAGHLTVIVMKCNKLKPMDITGKSDPYVKVNLMSAGKRVVKKKTSVKERSLDPVWNEVMVFEVPFYKAREIQFIFTVMDFDRHLPNKAIGQVVIGPRLAGAAMKHWTDMMNCPRKSVAMWHRIVKY